MSGTAISQGLTIAIAPILSRLYTPEAFGTFAIYSAIVGILVVIVTWRYELAILIPVEEKEAKNIFIISSLLVLSMSIIIFILIVFLKDMLASWLNIEHESNMLWWIPLSIFSMGLYHNLSYWSTRKKYFKKIATSHISRATIVSSSQVLGGILNYGSTGLISGQVGGQIVSAAVLGGQIYSTDKRIFKTKILVSDLKNAAYKYSDFPKYSAPQGLLNSASQNLPIFILSYYFGPVVLGFYALSMKFMQLPLSFITQSFKQVYYQKVTETINSRENYFNLLSKSTFSLMSISILPTLGILFFGKEIYSFILGDTWREAGNYAEWLIIWLFFGFLNSPSFVTAQALRLQKLLMYYEIVLIFSRSFILLVGGLYFTALQTIALYSLVGATSNLLLIIFVFYYARKKTII